jgi:DNA-binding transcriptional LysR family regulator
MQGLVAAGVGLALAPHLSIIAQRPDVTVLPIHNPTFTRKIEAVTLSDARKNQLVAQLLDLMDELWTKQPDHHEHSYK